MINNKWTQLQIGVGASTRKAATLAALFVLGCWIWYPLLSRAVAAARSDSPAAHHSWGLAIPSEAPVESSEVDSASTQEFWSVLATTLAEDPMFRTAEVRRSNRNPFQTVDVPQPLQINLATEPAPVVPVVPAVPVKINDDTHGLKLCSTVIGRTRRAALINGQLYELGRPVQTQAGTYLLTRIESERVVLSSGIRTIELTLVFPSQRVLQNRNEVSEPPH